MNWQNNISDLYSVLENLSIKNEQGNELKHDEGFSLWEELTLDIRRTDNRVFFIGNGASASMSSHFAADLAKNGKIQTEVFTDLSLLTAIANDISFEQVFAEPLKLKMAKGDMLVAISSSGNSPNVLRGAETARTLEGTVITLSAMKESNALRKLGDLNFYVPARTYGLAETGHAAILHCWMDSLETD
ncbi:MAG: SIS domain-containing protein [Desulfobacterales bacterium]|nr:SIS domain-containing protein [Desulfobacterales bacterium]